MRYLTRFYLFIDRFIGLRAENSGTYKCRIETMESVYEKEFELKIEGQDGETGQHFIALSPGWWLDLLGCVTLPLLPTLSIISHSLFFSWSDPRQNARSLLTPVSHTSFSSFNCYFLHMFSTSSNVLNILSLPTCQMFDLLLSRTWLETGSVLQLKTWNDQVWF